MDEQIGAQVGEIALWIESRGNKGTELEALMKAGLPVAALENSQACEDILFFADGSKSNRYGTYYGWYTRQDPHWKTVWGDRFGWETAAGDALRAAEAEKKRQADVRKLTKKPPKLSSADKTRLDEFSNRLSAAREAYELVQGGPFVILDTETTDLDDAGIVSLAVIDQWGYPIIDTLLNPQRGSEEGAFNAHGIEDWAVVGAPYFPDVWPTLCEVLQDKTVIIYNERFDMGVLADEARRWGVSAKGSTHARRLPDFESDCAMRMFARFYGEWNDRRRSYQWQKLTTAASYFGLQVEEKAHSALGDCLRTLGVLRAMSDFYSRYQEMTTWLKTS